MKKLLLIALLLPTIALAQDVDSLKRYNDRYTKSAISAFTYNRLHILLNNMLTLIGQGGGGGGTTVAMRSNGGYIQVQYNGGTWNNLVALSELQGPQGIQGTPGTNGTDGREIELTTTATHIQWRYVGGSYTNLVALADLRGADGSDATATTDAAALITGVLSNDRLQNIPLNKLAQSGAVAGSVIKWNGSAWAIGTDNTGGGGGAVNSVNSQQGDVVLNQDNIADGTTYKQYSQTEKTKLAGIEAGASNVRANHTGVQAQSTITNLTTDLAARLNLSDTSTMLTAYRNGLDARVRYTDTAAMLLPYANKINTKIGVTDTASMLAAYQAALNEVVDIPIDEFPTLGSTNPATSGGIRTKLDSLALAIAGIETGGGPVAWGDVTDKPTATGSGNLVYATSPTLTTPALGTPSAIVLTNGTGLPIGSGVSGLGTGIATFLATPSSANLRAALTDETGTGIAYFVGGALGTPSSATLTNGTGLPQSGVTGLTASLAAKMDTTANISGAATKASATWAAGTVTVNSNTQRHDILMTATGARTLVVSNINTVRSVVMWIDNTSGSTVTLTLPSNSFLQNTTTGVYSSAASVVIASGKTVLTLSNFDGTNYWFNY